VSFILTLTPKWGCDNYPEAFSIGVVHALFKGGDASKFDNNRGITVGPIITKLFAMILDKRLNKWTEQHGLHARVKLSYAKIIALSTNSSYFEL
jgi:hypothetical protein